VYCWWGKPKRVCAQLDYGEVELRLLKHFAEQENADLHTIVASRAFGIPCDQVTPQQRASAKAVTFAGIYGGRL
jgi:DNA polymerase-1